jgi:membrane-associated phospholipid phosphatase
VTNRSPRNPLGQLMAAVQTVDDRAVTWMATVDHRHIRPVLVVAARAGDLLAPVVAASLWVLLEGTPDERAAVLRGWAAMAVAATIENGLVKPAVKRRRPDAHRLPRGQRRSSSPSTSSLPAGHTGSVAAFSVVVGRSVPELRRWMASSVILLAYSHVYTGRHYLSDAVIGAVIGATTGRLCRRSSRGPAALVTRGTITPGSVADAGVHGGERRTRAAQSPDHGRWRHDPQS